MTLKSAVNTTVAGLLPLVALALAFRYFGNQPFISDVREGFKGNAK